MMLIATDLHRCLYIIARRLGQSEHLRYTEFVHDTVYRTANKLAAEDEYCSTELR